MARIAPTTDDICAAAKRVLTNAEYEAWWYHDATGLSQRQAAAALNISRSSLRSRLEAARPKIAAELQPYNPRHAPAKRSRKAPPR